MAWKQVAKERLILAYTHLTIPLPLSNGNKRRHPPILSHQVMIDQVGFPGRIQEVAIWEFVFNDGTDPFVVHFHMAWNHGQWLTPLSQKNSLLGTNTVNGKISHFYWWIFHCCVSLSECFLRHKNRCHASYEIPTKRWAGYTTPPSGSLGLTYCWWQPEIRRSPVDMDVSENSGTLKSSILIGFSIINHPFWGTPIFWKHPYGKYPIIYRSFNVTGRCLGFLEHQHYLHPHKASPSLVIQLFSQAAEFASFSHDCKESPTEGSICDLGISNIE